MKKRTPRISLFIGILLCITLAGIAYLFYALRPQKTSSPDKLVVVSPHPVAFAKPLIHEFEVATGIEVEVIHCGTSEALRRVTYENTADVMWGGSVSAVGSEAEFYNYRTEAYDALCPQWQDMGDGINCFSDVPSILMVNTDIIGTTTVTGYEDLLQPELKGRIAFANPGSSSSSFEQLTNMLYAMGGGNPEDGWDYVEAHRAVGWQHSRFLLRGI